MKKNALEPKKEVTAEIIAEKTAKIIKELGTEELDLSQKYAVVRAVSQSPFGFDVLSEIAAALHRCYCSIRCSRICSRF